MFDVAFCIINDCINGHQLQDFISIKYYILYHVLNYGGDSYNINRSEFSIVYKTAFIPASLTILFN